MKRILNSFKKRYTMKTEEITQRITERNVQDSIIKSGESPMTLKSSLNESQSEYNELKQLNANLSMRLNQVEDELDQLRHENSYNLDQKDRELVELGMKLRDLEANYEELTSTNTTLEFEIKTYRRLLECEENREVLEVKTPATLIKNNNKEKKSSSSLLTKLQNGITSTPTTTIGNLVNGNANVKEKNSNLKNSSISSVSSTNSSNTNRLFPTSPLLQSSPIYSNGGGGNDGGKLYDELRTERTSSSYQRTAKGDALKSIYLKNSKGDVTGS